MTTTPSTTPTAASELVLAIAAHAEAQIAEGNEAFDAIAGMSVEDVTAMIGKAKTLKGALAKLAPVVEARQAEIDKATTGKRVTECPACGHEFSTPRSLRTETSACRSEKMCAKRAA